MARHSGEPRSQRAGGTLAAFFLGSIAVHAAALAWLPSLTRDRPLPVAHALEVQILPPEPLPAALLEPAPQRRSQAYAARAPQNLRHEQPVLALPEPGLVDNAPQEAASDKPDSLRSEPVEKPGEETAPVTAPSVSAAYLRNPRPRYPDAARKVGEQGTVTLRVMVTREGLPARVEVERSSGSAHLDNAALEAVKAWRFTPARRGAERIESWMLVPVVFRLESAS